MKLSAIPLFILAAVSVFGQVTTINPGDAISSSRSVINGNFAYVNGKTISCVDATGSTTAYTCPTPSPVPTAYGAGMLVAFTPQTTSTSTTPTLNVAALGAKTIQSATLGTLAVGGLVASTTYLLEYNGTVLIMIASSTGATIPVVTNLIAGDGAGNGADSGIAPAVVTRKYFGTAAPGSVSGNLPGDQFTDTTNHNQYVCNAPSGTPTPACTSVTTSGWLLVNGGGGGGGTGNAASVVTTTFSATPTFTCPSGSAGTVTTFKLSTALSANITSSTLSGCTAGQTINFEFVQAASGGPYSVVMPTGFDPISIGAVAGAVTSASYAWDGTSARVSLPAQNGVGGVLLTNGTSASFGNIPTGGGGELDCATVPGQCSFVYTPLLTHSFAWTGAHTFQTPHNYSAGVAGGNAQTVTLSPAIVSLVNGFSLCWQPASANTGAATLVVNGIGSPLSIVKAPAATALAANDLITTAKACAIYDATGTQWELQNPQTASGGSSVPLVIAHTASSWTSVSPAYTQYSPDTVTHDTSGGAMWSSGSNPTNFYAPSTGTYTATCGLVSAAGGSYSMSVNFMINSSSWVTANAFLASQLTVSSYAPVIGSYTLFLNSGDYVSCWYYTSSSVTIIGGVNGSFMQLVKVGS